MRSFCFAEWRSMSTEQEYDMTLVGYARVSTEEQSLDMQVQALIKHGVHPDNIHVEKVSGVAAKRPYRDLAVKQLREGMTFVVWKFDRVGRDAIDLHKFVKNLDDRGIGFRSLTEYIDTKSAMGRLLMGILAVFAQFERDQIAERTKAGVGRYVEGGGKMGQPPKITDDNRLALETMLQTESVDATAKHFDISPSTIRSQYRASMLQEIRMNGPIFGRTE